MFDDFYDEPSEFDILIEEFKDGLRKAVKEEYVSKIDRLEKQIAEMQDLKKNWDKKVEKLEKAKREAENAKNEAMKEAKKLRLSELLSDKFQTAYGICVSNEYLQEKCNKCDDDGYIRFKSPQGNEMKEMCHCRKRHSVYRLTETEIVKLISNNKSTNKAVNVYYNYKHNKSNYYDTDEDIFEIVTNIADDKPYEEINSFYCVFLDKEKAQAYCDWLNKKSGGENQDD